MPETLKKTEVFRFDQMAVQVKDKIDPAEADVDRYVGLEHIDPESLKIRRWGETTDVESSKIIFKSGDIIFGKRRAYQRKLAVADFDGICSAHAMVLRPKTDVILEEFLPFFMQSDMFMDRAVKISVGGLSPTINWRDLAKEEFALPPLEEQRRIAEVLARVDGEQAALLDLQQYTRHCLEAAFEWEIGLRGHNSSMNHSKVYGSVPEGWHELKLAECCELITDGEHSTPPRTESGILLLSARNVLNRQLNLEDVDYISERTFDRLCRRIRPAPGDVLISCSGTIGRVCEVPANLDFALVRSVAIVRPTRSLVDHRFLAEALRSRFGQRQIKSLVGQTAQGNLFQGAIERLVLPDLPIDKQVAVAEICQQLSEADLSTSNRLIELKQFRHELMRRMLGVQQ